MGGVVRLVGQSGLALGRCRYLCGVPCTEYGQLEIGTAASQWHSSEVVLALTLTLTLVRLGSGSLLKTLSCDH